MDKVSISIVTWNSADTIKACLDSILNQTYSNLEVIIIDNDSSDKTTEILEAYPTLKVLKQQANLGFCKGHNIGIAAASGRYILPLNPDALLTNAYVENMVTALETDPKIGMVAGKLLLFNPTLDINQAVIDSTGLFLHKTRQQYLRDHAQLDVGQYDKIEYIFGACGAAPLYRKEMLEACRFEGQYFDESFFAHKEDVDLVWRAQLMGWKCIYTPHAVAFHDRTFKPGHRETISKEIRMHAVKNRYLLLIKNELPLTFAKHAFHILFYDLKIVGYLLLFEWYSFKGLFMVFSLIPQMLRWRKFIMSNRKVSSSYMLAWIK
jgi:GT2 family glycosyltransferase